MRDDAVLRRALPLGRGLGQASGNARPSTRVMETGHSSTRAVNSGSRNRALHLKIGP